MTHHPTRLEGALDLRAFLAEVKAAGAPISIALPARPMHPNAASLFVDLVLSREGSELLKSMGRVPTRRDIQPSAKRLDAKALDLFPLHVSSDEMDPEDFRKSFGRR